MAYSLDTYGDKRTFQFASFLTSDLKIFHPNDGMISNQSKKDLIDMWLVDVIIIILCHRFLFSPYGEQKSSCIV